MVDTLNALAADDTLVSALRSGGKASGDPSDLRALLDRLRGMPVPRQDVTEEVDASAAGGRDTTGDVTDEFEVAEAIRALLAPAQGPDEMGRLAGYRVLRLLGKGGMGLVFEAEDVHLQRRVAAKAMYPRARSRPAAGAARRFVRGGRWRRSSTTTSSTSTRWARTAAYRFWPCRCCKGRRWRRCWRGARPLSPAQAVHRPADGGGLAAARERGLIHRDVKPGNVWIEEGPRRTGQAARLRPGAAGGGGAGLTRQGPVVGTPAYMAPEQAFRAGDRRPRPTCSGWAASCTG
ncbi:MAG: hypothetical protein U0736_09860 [Gemmataceae bacterium]